MENKEIIDRLSLEQKISLISGKDSWWFHGVKNEGLNEIHLTDGPYGIREEIKDTSKSVSVSKTRSLCGDNLYIYSGNDDQTVPFMSLGALGVISVFSNFCPKEMHDICQLCLDDKFKAENISYSVDEQ